MLLSADRIGLSQALFFLVTGAFAITAHPSPRRIEAEPADQIANRKRRGSSGGRPPAFDPVDYKNRNHVERSFNHGKQWRGFATRYDKLGIVYRGAAVLNAIIRWLQRLRDTP